MTTYFILFIVATTASLIATPIIRRLCEHFNLLDVTLDARRVHDKAVPRLGGVAIYLSCVVALATLPIVDRLLTQSLAEQRSVIILTFIPATLVLMLGVYDDLKGTNAVVKFVALGLIATLFFLLGGRIVSLSIPLVGSVQLPLLASFLVTILWLVGIANAFNLI